MKALVLLLAFTLVGLHARPVAIGLTPDATTAVVAIQEPPSLRWLEAATLEPGPELKLPDQPSGLVISPDGARAFVVGGIAPGWIAIIDLKKARLIQTFDFGHSPCGPILSKDGELLWICDRFRHELVAFDWRKGEVVSRHGVEREPVACALAADGTLFVANHLPTGRADTGHIAAVLSVIDPNSGASQTIPLPNGSTGVEGLTISPDSKFLYLTHTLARYGLPTTQVDRGWMNTSAVSVIDAKQRRRLATVLLDDIDRGAANPWQVACSPDGRWLQIAHAGTHEISTIDRTALHEKLEQLTTSEARDAVSRDLSFLVGIRTRTPVPGKGPRALAAMSGRRLLVAARFSGTVHLINGEDIHSSSVPTSAEMDPVQRGESLFYDATLCFQDWQSCSSCHPNTRADALNWDLLNDGVGNPKQVKSMLFTVQTPPSMITGIRADAETAIKAGFRHIQFAVRQPDEVAAVKAYLETMQPVPSPALIDGKLSEAAERGRKVFETARCAYCHSGEYFTSLRQHHVGTSSMPLDTPTLREVWRTAPYLHDGRAPTLRSIFSEHNPSGRHGDTEDLSNTELDDLIEYIRSL